MEDVISYRLILKGMEVIGNARRELEQLPNSLASSRRITGQLLTGNQALYGNETQNFLKNTNNKTRSILKYAGGMNRFGKSMSNWGRNIGKASRQMTMLAMSSLGMFFSMFTLIGTLQQLFNMVINPLKDLSSAVENVALAEAFAGELGLDLNSIIGDTGDFVGGEIVPAWVKLQAIMAVVQVMFLKVATQLLNNEEFMSSLMGTLQKFIDAVGDGSMEKAFDSIGGSFFELIGGIIEGLPYFAALLDAIKSYLKYLGFFALLAVILMPVLSFLNLMLSGLAAVFTIAGAAISTTATIITAGGVGASLGLLPILLVLAGVIGMVAIVAIGAAKSFGIWDDMVNILVDTLDNLIDRLKNSDSFIVKIMGYGLDAMEKLFLDPRYPSLLSPMGQLIKMDLWGDEYLSAKMNNEGLSSPFNSNTTNYNNITMNVAKDTDLEKLNDWLREQLNLGWIGSI
jgi:hypothetical protein